MELLKTLPSESVDAIVTDPPYELGFMGKKWDASGIAYNVELWAECLRVLKPGGHLLAFSGTRTYHRMAVAIEDAGFEVRDMLEWCYASGFPKSLNIGKAVDKLQGNEREYLGEDPVKTAKRPKQNEKQWGCYSPTKYDNSITKGSSEWEGFGTALKPAHEPICMARKPLSEKTIVENVLKHGTGAIDIDGCRIPTSDTYQAGGMSSLGVMHDDNWKPKEIEAEQNQLGRFPANIICTDDALNDGVMTKSGARKKQPYDENKTWYNKMGGMDCEASEGSKSRYFDIDVWAEKHGLLQFPKASKAERNKGCEGLKEKQAKGGGGGIGDYLEDVNSASGKFGSEKAPANNHHPTVKPVHLMAWLIRLVSKEGDVVLDPFGGSGTTGVACNMFGRKFILMEQSEEYIEIIKSRTTTQPTLFDQ